MFDNIVVSLYQKGPSILKKLIKKIYGSSVKKECESSVLRKIWKEYYGVDIGMYSYGCFNDCFPAGTKVGKYCSISKGVKSLNADHPLSSTCLTPYFYNKSLGFETEDVPRTNLEIGNDVWIGYGTILLSKCTKIGNGAVIGAGSVITKDVPAYSIVVGNPGRVLRYRFDDETCQKLDETKWWNQHPSQLINYKEYMSSPEDFIQNIMESIND